MRAADPRARSPMSIPKAVHAHSLSDILIGANPEPRSHRRGGIRHAAARIDAAWPQPLTAQRPVSSDFDVVWRENRRRPLPPYAMVAGPGARIAVGRTQARKRTIRRSDRTRRFTNDAVQIGQRRETARDRVRSPRLPDPRIPRCGPPNTLSTSSPNTDDAGGAVLLRDITGVALGLAVAPADV